jgi:hypothetical protein
MKIRGPKGKNYENSTRETARANIERSAVRLLAPLTAPLVDAEEVGDVAWDCEAAVVGDVDGEADGDIDVNNLDGDEDDNPADEDDDDDDDELELGGAVGTVERGGAVESVPTVMVAGVAPVADVWVSDAGMGMVDVAAGRGASKEPDMLVSWKKGE